MSEPLLYGRRALVFAFKTSLEGGTGVYRARSARPMGLPSCLHTHFSALAPSGANVSPKKSPSTHNGGVSASAIARMIR